MLLPGIYNFRVTNEVTSREVLFIEHDLLSGLGWFLLKVGNLLTLCYVFIFKNVSELFDYD